MRYVMMSAIFLLLSQVVCGGSEAHQCPAFGPEQSIYGWMLQRHIYKTMMADLGLDCLLVCRKDDRCQSFNFVISLHMCEFSDRTKEARPEDFIADPDRYYFRRDIKRASLGQIPELAAESCKEIKASEEQVVSGKFWLSTIKKDVAVHAYCDMKTEDVDECTASSPVCDVNAICNNTIGSYCCTCKVGYYGDGRNCTEDIDECSTSPSVCDINALCHNNLGSYVCSCKTGFVGDGKTCSTDEPLNATSTCGFPSSLVRVTNSSGTIWSSGGWPYSHNMSCSWHLSGKALLELVFDSFRTHSSADYLVVYAGDSPNAPLVGQFSGTSLPAPIYSSSGKLYMKFISDASGNDYGFRARYQVLKAGSIRLQGNETSTGRVEIFYDNQWGTICDSSWDINDANVVCRQLNSPHALLSFGGAFHGQGSGPIWMAGVSCHGNESRLYDCTHRGWGVSDCSHSRDASVKCSSVRLVNGGPNYGRVEVLYKGIWGTVCDDLWNIDDAHVICRQLGFSSAAAANKTAAYGEGSDPIWLDNVKCNGDEASIFNCGYPGWGIHNCGHWEDASVICNIS